MHALNDYAGSLGSNLNLINTKMNENKALYEGAALMLQGSKAWIMGSEFKNNMAALYGGAIAAHGANLTITDSNFTHNSAFQGGALYVSRYVECLTVSKYVECLTRLPWELYLTGSKFYNNSAAMGGALHAEQQGDAFLDHVDYQGNTASIASVASLASHRMFDGARMATPADSLYHGVGGAICFRYAGMDMVDALFKDNTASVDGGECTQLLHHISSPQLISTLRVGSSCSAALCLTTVDWKGILSLCLRYFSGQSCHWTTTFPLAVCSCCHCRCCLCTSWSAWGNIHNI
jgi:predicted outer membrane repeat protein